MYDFIVSTNGRNKEPKKQGSRKNQEKNTMKQNKTRGKKSQNTKKSQKEESLEQGSVLNDKDLMMATIGQNV
jgi:hypothetical protein